MRKTLRGKRHIRARATVAIGREKRRQHKVEREIEAWNYFINHALPNLVSSALPEMIRAVEAMRDACSQIVQALIVPMREVVRFISENPEEFSRRFNELSKAKTTS